MNANNPRQNAQNWFDKARNDIAAANNLHCSLNDYENAAFHYQQAVEKLLKGVLVSYNVTDIEDVMWSHDIEGLADAIIDYTNLSVPDDIYNAADIMNHWEAETRYPSLYYTNHHILSNEYNRIRRQIGEWLDNIEAFGMFE